MIKTVLISGAGVAGPALAYWLARFGLVPTLVERAPALREGGQAVDFRGEAHLGVRRRMGLLDAIRAKQTQMGAQHFVDAAGRRFLTLPAEFMSGDVEIARGDLCRILYEATRDRCEYIFGDAITGLVEHAGGVEVTFARGERRSFDLVIGADGLRSGVRALAFGDDIEFVRYLGYHVAAFSIPNFLGLQREGLLYSEPGRGVGVMATSPAGDARALLVFASDPLPLRSLSLGAQKRILRDAFAGAGWEAQSVVRYLEDANDLYFDGIAQVDLPSISKGRIALVGDAAFGGTLGGQGTGGAVVGAYLLAGELARAGNDYRAGFSHYESRLRPYASSCQKGAQRAGSFFAPRSRAGLLIRNGMYALLASSLMEPVLRRLVKSAANGIVLQNYESDAA
jgi:2-polyprenyl-6-methoxyphenol hydroxylase-like FAD-dependent oxidoreductase